MKSNNTSLTIKATTVFEQNWNALNSSCRFIKNEGGSRSSKTYSLCQALILYCLQNRNKLVSIVRKTGPALKATVYRDFIEILRNMNLYNSANHKKGDGMYVFHTGSAIEFFSVDQEQKLRGRKRDIAWVNEANELSYEDFQQLAIRTDNKLIVDYNPSAVESYLYHLPEENTISIHSTYKDNIKFLSEAIIDQLESYRNSDPDYYNIFCLGLRAQSKECVFNAWDTLPGKPQNMTDFVYGIDYGYSHPTALVKIWYNENAREVFIEELIYESYLTSTDIVERMEKLGVSKQHQIVSETARPEIIADLKRAGFRVIGADKNVKDGITNMKSFKIYLDENAKNVKNENFNYRYKKINGIIQDEPIKLYDDAMDAIRYALMHVKRYCLKEANQPTKVYSFNI